MFAEPLSTEAEEGLIGAVIIRPDLLIEAGDVIRGPEDFASHSCAVTWKALIDLSREGNHIDFVTLVAHLGAKVVEVIGGTTWLSALIDAAPVPSQALRYARIVSDYATRRRIMEAGRIIVAKATEDGVSIEDMVDTSEKLISRISFSASVAIPYQPASEAVARSLENIEAAHSRGKGLAGLPSGWSMIDWYLAGLQPGQLIIVGARPAMGKTALGLQVAEHVASLWKRVLFLSLEMPRDQIMLRSLSRESGVDSQRLRKGHAEGGELDRVYRAADVVSKLPFWIDDTPSLTTYQVRSRARRLKAEHGLDLIVVDYLQLMRSGQKPLEKRDLEIGEISRGLKGLAKELGVPVVALSQLNRNVESRSDKRPMISDLRESGSIEQDADVIMFIYRDEVYNKDTREKGVAEIIIGKNRSGPIGTVRLSYEAITTTFRSMETVL